MTTKTWLPKTYEMQQKQFEQESFHNKILPQETNKQTNKQQPQQNLK